MRNIHHVSLDRIANTANQIEASWRECKRYAIKNIKDLCERSNNFSENNIKRLKTIFSKDKIQGYSLLQIIRLENLFDEVITQLEKNSDAISALNVIKDWLLTTKLQKITEIKDRIFSENRNDLKVDEDIQGYFLFILEKNIENVEEISFLNFIPTKQEFNQKSIAAESPIDETKITILYCGEEFNDINLPDGYYFAQALGFEGNPYALVLKDIHTLYEKMHLYLKDQQMRELKDLMNKHGVIKDKIDDITSIRNIVELLDAMLAFHVKCDSGTVYNGDYSADEGFQQIHQKMSKFVSYYNYLIQTEPQAAMPRLVEEQSVANGGLDGFAPAVYEAYSEGEANEGSDGDASDPQEVMPRLVEEQPVANGGSGGDVSSSKYKIGKVIFTVLFAISGLACLAMVVLSKQILNTAIAKIFNSNLFIAIFSVFCAFAMVAIICNIPVVNKAIQASLSVKRDVGNINSKALKI